MKWYAAGFFLLWLGWLSIPLTLCLRVDPTPFIVGTGGLCLICVGASAVETVRRERK